MSDRRYYLTIFAGVLVLAAAFAWALTSIEACSRRAVEPVLTPAA